MCTRALMPATLATIAALCCSCSPAPRKAVAVTVGDWHSCALLEDRTVWCWGGNGSGSLGKGDPWQPVTATPVAVKDLAEVVQISAGSQHTCALLADRRVRCWGNNSAGQLGDGTFADRYSPVEVRDLAKVSSIEAGHLHTCALVEDGSVACWGYDLHGQLGDGVPHALGTQGKSAPVTAAQLADAVSISAGALHSCALRSSGSVSCWGWHGGGQYGDAAGYLPPALVPTPIAHAAGATELAAGEHHNCALHTDGRVECWGVGLCADRESKCQLGDGSLTDAKQVAVGVYHSCAVRRSGQVACWGKNEQGELGDGTTKESSVPVEVTGLGDVVHLAVGTTHACAVRSDGSVWCWGNNQYGKLGATTATESQTTPVAVRW